jgi:2-polyprenyl-3-methyl-5-hydroxy-6-metoxy-1,4-benzoquinol methylase
MDEADSYYAQSRAEMLPFLPRGLMSLIDIGCAGGWFGAMVKKTYPAAEIWGVEPVESVASEAASRADRIIVSEIEKAEEQLPAQYFDVVTMNDVLEHLPYPEPALALARHILKPDGRLILSLPNVRYYVNVKNLIVHGDWHYQDFGILDRTHMKFYTQRSARRTLSENGFSVERIVGINPAKLRPHYRALFALAPRFFEDARYPQFAMVARPN